MPWCVQWLFAAGCLVQIGSLFGCSLFSLLVVQCHFQALTFTHLLSTQLDTSTLISGFGFPHCLWCIPHSSQCVCVCVYCVCVLRVCTLYAIIRQHPLLPDDCVSMKLKVAANKPWLSLLFCCVLRSAFVVLSTVKHSGYILWCTLYVYFKRSMLQYLLDIRQQC